MFAKVLVENTHLPFSIYSDTLINKIQRNAGKILIKPENITLSGSPGYSIQGLWMDKSFKEMMKVFDNWTIHNGKVYRLSFYSPDTLGKYYEPIVDDIVQSFKLLK